MTTFRTATAIGIILAATPALAQVTPQSAWDQLSSYYETLGLEVETSSVDESGDTVTVNDLVLRQTSDDAELMLDFGQLTLSANGDDSVSIDLQDEASGEMIYDRSEDAASADDGAETDGSGSEADEMPEAESSDGVETDAASEAMSGSDGEEMADEPAAMPERITFTMRMPGETMTVREEGGDSVYDYTFPTFDVLLDGVEMTDGTSLSELGRLTFTDLVGTDRFANEGGTDVRQTGTVASMELAFDIAQQDGSAVGNVTVNGLGFESATRIPEGVALDAEFSDGDLEGVAISGEMTADALTAQMDFDGLNEEGEAVQTALGSDVDGLNLTFALDDERLSYGGGSGTSTVDMTLPNLPAPVGYSTESASFNLDMPMAADPEPQEFTVDYDVSGLTLTDSVWAMFDPQNALPRDPASLAVKLNGLATLDVGFMDSEAMSDPETAPGSFDELNIEEVSVSALGASVNASGQLESPEGGDLSTPVGTISGRIEGANALIDMLGEAGFIPQEQMMGVRMMLTMFAKPDPENEDVLTSEFEFRNGGEIYANGQRVK
ncbi:hypothetical protein SAMN05421538_101682 [Paracoccus isoporae]|uniref:DUF2125 domain-containing protein n=1 Tax=Paracoccus isoporae TaxID=591205 RepID=A0A1G6V1L7_9RHOB|nr:DUF2125 domain-containing protein [Paracoccus isoporae]SDD47393.1 hypothetical protein SAMN05421538_101682 [Paracoccus isoporae]